MSEIGPERLNLNFHRISIIDGDHPAFEEAIQQLKDMTKKEDELLKKGHAEGFVDLDFAGEPEEEILQTVLEQLIGIRYVKEAKTSTQRWFRRVSNNKIGDLTRGFPVSFKSMDVIWFYPTIILLRGPEKMATDAFKSFARALGIPPFPEFLRFDPQFLFWMLVRWMDGQGSISNRLELVVPISLRIRGIEEYSGREVIVEDIDDLFKSIPSQTALLDGLGISEIKAVFRLEGGITCAVRIYSVGGFWVYVEEYLNTGAPKSDRFSLSAHFADCLVDAYKEWQTLSDEERYVPENKYNELANMAKKQIDRMIEEGESIRRAAKSREERRRRQEL